MTPELQALAADLAAVLRDPTSTVANIGDTVDRILATRHADLVTLEQRLAADRAHLDQWSDTPDYQATVARITGQAS